jgi:hypothetical protein
MRLREVPSYCQRRDPVIGEVRLAVEAGCSECAPVYVFEPVNPPRVLSMPHRVLCFFHREPTKLGSRHTLSHRVLCFFHREPTKVSARHTLSHRALCFSHYWPTKYSSGHTLLLWRALFVLPLPTKYSSRHTPLRVDSFPAPETKQRECWLPKGRLRPH